MHIASVNIGTLSPIVNAKSTGLSGIFKRPVAGPVAVTPLGLEGDAIADAQNHGGVDQAVYVYGLEDYAWWAQTLGLDLLPGTFGENLTVSGLESARFRVGDCLQAGPVQLQVTAPRIPCVTLAARMGDAQFVKRFRKAERPGLYCRVLAEGLVQAGDPLTLTPYAGETISVLEMMREFYTRSRDPAVLRRHLAAPIAVRARVEKEKRLAEIEKRGIG